MSDAFNGPTVSSTPVRIASTWTKSHCQATQFQLLTTYSARTISVQVYDCFGCDQSPTNIIFWGRRPNGTLQHKSLEVVNMRCLSTEPGNLATQIPNLVIWQLKIFTTHFHSSFKTKTARPKVMIRKILIRAGGADDSTN